MKLFLKYQIKPCKILLSDIKWNSSFKFADNRVMTSVEERKKKYLCYICMLKFKTWSDLNTHKVSHNKKESDENIVKECNKRTVKAVDIGVIPKSITENLKNQISLNYNYLVNTETPSESQSSNVSSKTNCPQLINLETINNPLAKVESTVPTNNSTKATGYVEEEGCNDEVTSVKLNRQEFRINPTPTNFSCDLCYDVFNTKEDLDCHMDFHKQLENDFNTVIDLEEDEIVEVIDSEVILTKPLNTIHQEKSSKHDTVAINVEKTKARSVDNVTNRSNIDTYTIQRKKRLKDDTVAVNINGTETKFIENFFNTNTIPVHIIQHKKPPVATYMNKSKTRSVGYLTDADAINVNKSKDSTDNYLMNVPQIKDSDIIRTYTTKNNRSNSLVSLRHVRKNKQLKTVTSFQQNINSTDNNKTTTNVHNTNKDAVKSGGSLKYIHPKKSFNPKQVPKEKNEHPNTRSILSNFFKNKQPIYSSMEAQGIRNISTEPANNWAVNTDTDVIYVDSDDTVPVPSTFIELFSDIPGGNDPNTKYYLIQTDGVNPNLQQNSAFLNTVSNEIQDRITTSLTEDSQFLEQISLRDVISFPLSTQTSVTYTLPSDKPAIANPATEKIASKNTQPKRIRVLKPAELRSAKIVLPAHGIQFNDHTNTNVLPPQQPLHPNNLSFNRNVITNPVNKVHRKPNGPSKTLRKLLPSKRTVTSKPVSLGTQESQLPKAPSEKRETNFEIMQLPIITNVTSLVEKESSLSCSEDSSKKKVSVVTNDNWKNINNGDIETALPVTMIIKD